MAVRHARPARRQQCKGHLRLFHEMLVHLLPACPITQHKLPLFRAHGHLGRLSHIFMVQCRRREPASPTRFPSIRVQISTTGTRASCAIPVGHGPSSATGTHANSAVPLSRGINSAMGGDAFQTPPPSTMAREPALQAPPPPGHASHSNDDAVMARRPPSRTCSPSRRSDQVVAVGLRCG